MPTDIEISDLHASGLSHQTMSEHLGCSKKTIARACKRLGLAAKFTGKAAGRINDHIFDIIDTQEKAYWLGFLLADGCIAKNAGSWRALRLFIKRSDLDHLKAFGKFVGYGGKYHQDRRKGHIRSGVVFNSVPMTTKLAELGWFDFKRNGDTRIFRAVPPHLVNHMVRGYFDGDGSISRGIKRKSWYAAIVGPHPEPMQAIADIVSGAIGVVRKVKPRKNTHIILWNGRDQLRTVFAWMYRDAIISMPRKRLRMEECLGDNAVFHWRTIYDFNFELSCDELLQRTDREEVLNRFVNCVIGGGWSPPRYDIQNDLVALATVDPLNYIKDGEIRAGRSPGNKAILSLQPTAWEVRLGKKPAFSSLTRHHKIVERASRALLFAPGGRIYPDRFLRELHFAGLTRASLLSTPVIMAALKHFGADNGSWFDPCAGWGNRLLAAHTLGMSYSATDPGYCYHGLLRLKEAIGSNAALQNLPWQTADWPKSDVVMTSPPFHDKEDYGDGAKYGKFEDWYLSFLKPLVEQSLERSITTILHVDKPMRDRLAVDFEFDELPMVSANRHKAPTEWFLRVLNRHE